MIYMTNRLKTVELERVPVSELLVQLGRAPAGKADPIITALVSHGVAAVDELIGAMSSPNARIRRRVPRALAQIGDRRAVQSLLDSVNDPTLG